MCDFLRVRCELAERFTEEEVLHVLGAIDVNSVRIHCQRPNRGPANADSQQQQPLPGHALYPLTALLSHACIANSKTVLSSDYSNECRATVFIKKGEEITKQYCSPLETTNQRRAKLSHGWFFQCECIRCKAAYIVLYVYMRINQLHIRRLRSD